MIKKCAGRISFLYRNASLLDLNCRRILCSALVLPHLDYCCSSWYSSLTGKLKSRLDVLQRRVIRLIYSMDARDHVGTGELLKLSWLSIPDRVRFFKLCHVFKIRHNLAPRYLSINFTPISGFHSYYTRGSSHNYVISKGLANAPFSFCFTAIKEWNSLPLDLKKIESFMVFRTKLKQFLSSSY